MQEDGKGGSKAISWEAIAKSKGEVMVFGLGLDSRRKVGGELNGLGLEVGAGKEG